MASGIPVDAASRAIASTGFWVGRDASRVPLLARLYAGLIDRDTCHTLAPAGIGGGTSRFVDPEIRGDRIAWIEPGTDAEHELFNGLDELRRSLGRALFLSLVDLEAHYAIYAPGARYERHVDQLKGDGRRVLSFVLYLNPQWTTSDGGELVLYRVGSHRGPTTGRGLNDPFDASTQEEPTRVLPAAGTLVIFRSADVPHEVLPAHRPRASIVGWFRQRA